jgi:hypothetical protein
MMYAETVELDLGEGVTVRVLVYCTPGTTLAELKTRALAQLIQQVEAVQNGKRYVTADIPD